jgi:tetratricopeptide (TPR) repeat protein
VTAYETALGGFLEADAGQATVLNNAGFAYFRLGRLDKAVDYLTRAVAADPENSEAQLNLGLIYYDLGRFEDALTPLEAALAQNPSLAETPVDTGEGDPLPFSELLERVRQAQP